MSSKTKTKGQVAVEYILLLGGVIVIVALVTVFMQDIIFKPQKATVENQTKEFRSLVQQLQSPSPTPQTTPTPTATPTPSPTPTITPTPTPTPSPTTPAQKICGIYFNQTGQTQLVQGTWTDSPTAVSSKDACYAYMQQNILSKKNCAQPNMVPGTESTIVLMDRARHTFYMPTLSQDELVQKVYCPTSSQLVVDYSTCSLYRDYDNDGFASCPQEKVPIGINLSAGFNQILCCSATLDNRPASYVSNGGCVIKDFAYGQRVCDGDQFAIALKEGNPIGGIRCCPLSVAVIKGSQTSVGVTDNAAKCLTNGLLTGLELTGSSQPVNAFCQTVASPTMERVGVLTLSAGEDYLLSALIDSSGAYAYFGTFNYPGKIVKISLSDFTKVGGTLNLNNGENRITSAAINTTGYAYFGTADNPARFARVSTASFTETSALTLNTGEDQIDSLVLSPDGQYAFLGTGGHSTTNYGRIIKIRLSDYTRVSTLAVGTAEGVETSVIDKNGQYGYFGLFRSPGKILKVLVNQNTLQNAGTLTFRGTGENMPTSAVIDSTNSYAYFGTWTAPGKIIRVRLSTFTQDGTITLSSGEGPAASMVIDPNEQYLYVGVDSSPGKVVKIRLSDFTRNETITLNSGENRLLSAAIDPSGRHVYFGTGTYPGKIVRVRVG